MPSLMKLSAVTLDCADPQALAGFYQQATGLGLHPGSDDTFAGVTGADGMLIGFQRVDGYRAPVWPGQDVPQQFHLDFTVDDLHEAERVLVNLGATTPECQPNERWRVLIDPAGHPFCLTTTG